MSRHLLGIFFSRVQPKQILVSWWLFGWLAKPVLFFSCFSSTVLFPFPQRCFFNVLFFFFPFKGIFPDFQVFFVVLEFTLGLLAWVIQTIPLALL